MVLYSVFSFIYRLLVAIAIALFIWGKLWGIYARILEQLIYITILISGYLLIKLEDKINKRFGSYAKDSDIINYFDFFYDKNMGYHYRNQYGGSSYEAKQRNEYSILGEYVPISDVTVVHYVGDIFITGEYSYPQWHINRSNGENHNQSRQWNLYEILSITGIETTINIGARNDGMIDWGNVDTSIEYRFFTLENNFKLLTAYNQKSSLEKFYPLASTFREVDEFPNRIIASPAKYPGEMVDNWTQILPNEYMDVDGKYGAIQRLYSFKDEVIAFQDEAVAQIAILPRVQTTGNDGVGIYLGTGQLLHDYNYITTKSGMSDGSLWHHSRAKAQRQGTSNQDTSSLRMVTGH